MLKQKNMLLHIPPESQGNCVTGTGDQGKLMRDGSDVNY